MDEDDSFRLRPLPSLETVPGTSASKHDDYFIPMAPNQKYPPHEPFANGTTNIFGVCMGSLHSTPSSYIEGSDTETLASEHHTRMEGFSSDLGVAENTTNFPIPNFRNIVVELPVSTLNNPRSVYSGFIPPAPVRTESEAVTILLEVLRQESPDLDHEDFIEFDLSNFTIYLDSVVYPNELRPLQHLATRTASDKFYFDGTLSVGEKQIFLQKIAFRELPLGNYGVSEDTVGDQIWIRSEFNHEQEIYYKLGKPSLEYKRFYTPFLWIADMAKHVIDYCQHLHEKKCRVTLFDFRSRFAIFIYSKHKSSAAFQSWYSAHGDTDFRGALVSNFGFIWKEAVGVLGRQQALWHRFWGEIGGEYYKPNIGTTVISSTSDDESEFASSIPKVRSRAKAQVAETIVTPYIYDLFKHMGFENIMKAVPPVEETKHKQACQIDRTKLIGTAFRRHANRSNNERAFIKSIQPGDVISTPPDDEGTDSLWKREGSNHHDSDYVWYALVQKVHLEKGHYSFDVLWMYQPRDTPCALMKYPWAKELFLSDSCTCGGRRVDENDILDAHTVNWFGKPWTSTSDFFVRQTYLANDRCWVSLKQDHMTCQHQGTTRKQGYAYQVGDTVLVQSTPPYLDAFIIESISDAGRRQWATVRKLIRRREVDADMKPSSRYAANELIYSNQLIDINIGSIVRLCLVRVFRLDEKIPAPYDRNGTGDAFFITHQEVMNGDATQYLPVDDPKSLRFRHGFDQTRTTESRKLRGLDLFCGGGNFGRGLEDSGAIEMKWANDISSNAIHTYMANCRPDACTPYLGSIDDLLYRALQGMPDVPQPGDVQFISGGSPCQGFSRLTSDQTTARQQKNRSLVASFASFVDLYRPEYGLLENVLSIVQSATTKKREECFFSQLICSIVGLGYQVRIIYADAWSYGASQSRSRLFLSFAAPGVEMPKMPVPSHSNPPATSMGKVGTMSNGEPFGERFNIPTPFKFVSASEAVGDLPDIQDGKADYCIGFPDHRLSIGYTRNTRTQMRHIPTLPWGMNYGKAYFGYEDRERRVPGTLSEADRLHLFPKPTLRGQRVMKGSKGWGRIHPNRLFSTVTTICSPTDARTGTINHWEQLRPMTILEVRRAQGFLDDELLLGKPAEQWHIVGNSVARPVALALGLTIREAWLGTLYDEDTQQPAVKRIESSHHVPCAHGMLAAETAGGSMEAETIDMWVESATDVQSGAVFSDVPKENASVSTPATSIDDGSGPRNAAGSGVPEQEIIFLSERKRRSTASFCIEIPTKRARVVIDLT